MKNIKFQKILKLNYNIVLVVHNVRSCHNVGSFFRTADAVGVKKIFLCGYTSQPPHPKIEKTALGAQKIVPFEKSYSTVKVIKQLKSQGYQIVSLELHKKSENILNFHPKFPMAIIVGNEVEGLPPKILKLSDKIVFIPMFGQKESLNVSVAFGIACYMILQNYLRLS